MHFQNLRSADRKGYQQCFCDTNQHLEHYIAFAVWRARFGQNVILPESHKGTGACYSLSNFYDLADVPSCVYVTEAKSPNEANHLKRVFS